MTERTLSVGDVLYARPCIVTIEFINYRMAHGNCRTCQTQHLIDGARYRSGSGPWQPVDFDADPVVHRADPRRVGTLDFDEAVQDLADVLYDLGGPGGRERYIDYAQRVADALHEAGYAIVPTLDND